MRPHGLERDVGPAMVATPQLVAALLQILAVSL